MQELKLKGTLPERLREIAEGLTARNADRTIDAPEVLLMATFIFDLRDAADQIEKAAMTPAVHVSAFSVLNDEQTRLAVRCWELAKEKLGAHTTAMVEGAARQSLDGGSSEPGYGE